VAHFPSSPQQRQLLPGQHRRWLLAVVGLVWMTLSEPLLWQPERKESWSAPLGIGLVLTAWLGLRLLPLIFCQFLLAHLVLRWNEGLAPALLHAILGSATIGGGWWCYHHQAGGARRLDDPRSATLFLLLVPGLFAGLSAVLQVVLGYGFPLPDDWPGQVLDDWIGQSVALLALAPMLLVVCTPWVVYYRWALPDKADQPFLTHPRLTWSTGDLLETVGLALGAGVLGGTLAVLHTREISNWHLWGVLLLVIVWASLRLGLRGGSLVAGSATVLALVLGTTLTANNGLLLELRGNLLAQCSTALLIGASADWIRASEARYRQIVGHIPVMLYSARFLRKPAPGVAPEVVILLASAASRHIHRCEPEALIGSYDNWLARIHAADRELMRAAVAQLLLQKQAVTCEYRLAESALPAAADNGPTEQAAWRALQNLVRKTTPSERWVRDTLVPHDGPDEELDGWEGIVEDITNQRLLAHDLRRTTNMLHALVANLPTGVFFVHGVNGQPLLVNARARQLLGQREDLAAGLSHLAAVYRLHRADGQPYPWDELPVYQALRHGTTSMRDDIVVHRPDGRRVPLVTWAAPVNLGSAGEPDAAVWVLEDLSALRQAEAARQDTELRLRVVVETMAEGLIVQNQAGVIVECNPAACAILGVGAEQLRGSSSLGPQDGCVQETGASLPREAQPDRVVFRTGKPVRDMVIGIRAHTAEAGTNNEPPVQRWILANSMPVSLTDKLGDNRGQRCVTTFADITAHRQALEVLRQSEEQYRGLVETMPLMLLRFAPDGTLSYLNPATRTITGYGSDELRQPGFWQSCIHVDDRPALAALMHSTTGQSAGLEFRYRAADGSEHVGYALTQPLRSAGSTVLVVDMTHRRRMEQELQKVQRLELVARIASGVVHDFNNLLTVILSYAELVKFAIGNHPARHDLERISEAGNQAARLAGQLLTFSKQRQVVMRLLDFNTIVTPALDLLRPALPPNVEVRSQQHPGEAWVLADEAPLQQVVMNLCLNARDAMQQGGTLVVETAVDDCLPGNVPVDGGVNRWVRFSVQDNGSGMEEAVQARMFEPLFTTKEYGSGLGLAVVKQIVEGFGGRMRVTSAPEQGTRFDVWLPFGQ
jgi:PAS domain S-box-containing protein